MRVRRGREWLGCRFPGIVHPSQPSAGQKMRFPWPPPGTEQVLQIRVGQPCGRAFSGALRPIARQRLPRQNPQDSCRRAHERGGCSPAFQRASRGRPVTKSWPRELQTLCGNMLGGRNQAPSFRS
eukprot:gene23949-biopygen5876